MHGNVCPDGGRTNTSGVTWGAVTPAKRAGVNPDGSVRGIRSKEEISQDPRGRGRHPIPKGGWGRTSDERRACGVRGGGTSGEFACVAVIKPGRARDRGHIDRGGDVITRKHNDGAAFRLQRNHVDHRQAREWIGEEDGGVQLARRPRSRAVCRSGGGAVKAP